MNTKQVIITVNTGDHKTFDRFVAEVSADVNPSDIVNDLCREYSHLKLRRRCQIFVNRPWEPLRITFVARRGWGVVASVFLTE